MFLYGLPHPCLDAMRGRCASSTMLHVTIPDLRRLSARSRASRSCTGFGRPISRGATPKSSATVCFLYDVRNYPTNQRASLFWEAEPAVNLSSAPPLSCNLSEIIICRPRPRREGRRSKDDHVARVHDTKSRIRGSNHPRSLKVPEAKASSLRSKSNLRSSNRFE